METALLSLDEAISDCIVNITDFNPKTKTRIFGALLDQSAVNFCFDEDSDQMLPILAGSVAELTIKTPLPCFGDSDFMLRIKCSMVIPFGTAFPTKECLSKYGCNKIELWSYRQTKFPAYVRPYFVGILSFDKEADAMNFVPCTHAPPEGVIHLDWHFRCVHNEASEPAINHGPAFAVKGSYFMSTNGYHEVKSFSSTDIVICILCLHWPPEAREFYERRRPNSWPTKGTIKEVVSLGCDFVQVSHPLYKKHDSKPQWRMSFSRAEIILIRTWSNTQKIVYHLLRYLNKNTHISKDHVICTYHLKTLMLWNCEKRPSEYWNCRHLMHIVADMLSELKQCAQAKQLQHYFILNCSLVFKNRRQRDNGTSCNANTSEYSPDQLSSLEVRQLSDWFLRNYLFVLAAKCPENESGKMVQDFKRTETNDRINKDWIQTFTQALLNDYTLAKKLFEDLNFSIKSLSHSRMYEVLQVHQSSFRYVFGMLQQADARLVNFFRAFILLNAAQEIEQSKQLPNRWFVDIILNVVIDFKDGEDCIWELAKCDDQFQTAASCFNTALCILRTMADRKESEANGLLLELAKCCFKKSLQYSDSLAISSAAVVYLALISYKQRLYEEATDLCMLVIECPYARKIQGINRDFLKTLDLPYLSAFSGFAELVFNFYTERNATLKTDANEYPPGIVAIMLLKDILDIYGSNVSNFEHLEKKLSTELENHKCRRHTNETLKQSSQNSKNEYNSTLILHKIRQYVKKFSNFQRNLQQKIAIYSRCSVQQLPKSGDDLFNSLLELSVRYLTAFYLSVKEDLEPSKHCVITDQYMMLNSFRRGDYATALEMSDRIIAIYAQNKIKPRMAYEIFHVIVSPPFNLLLDDQLKLCNNNARRNFESGVHFIDTRIVALYINTECLLRLGKSVLHFLMPVLSLHEYAKNETYKLFLASAEISCYQLHKLSRFFNGRHHISEKGQIMCRLTEEELSEYLENPNPNSELSFD